MIMLDYSYIQIISFERTANVSGDNNNNNVDNDHSALVLNNGRGSEDENEQDDEEGQIQHGGNGRSGNKNGTQVTSWFDLNESLLSSVIKEEEDDELSNWN